MHLTLRNLYVFEVHLSTYSVRNYKVVIVSNRYVILLKNLKFQHKKAKKKLGKLKKGVHELSEIYSNQPVFCI